MTRDVYFEASSAKGAGELAIAVWDVPTTVNDQKSGFGSSCHNYAIAGVQDPLKV